MLESHSRTLKTRILG